VTTLGQQHQQQVDDAVTAATTQLRLERDYLRAAGDDLQGQLMTAHRTIRQQADEIATLRGQYEELRGQLARARIENP
jgi:chromosome segregation ATPase